MSPEAFQYKSCNWLRIRSSDQDIQELSVYEFILMATGGSFQDFLFEPVENTTDPMQPNYQIRFSFDGMFKDAKP